MLGTVVGASAQLTPSRDGIYSLFVVKPGLIFKDLSPRYYRIDEEMTCLRLGGAVRFPSGRIREFRLRGEGFPVVDRDYILFLKSGADRSPPEILTGYLNEKGHALPLDSVRPGNRPALPFESVRNEDFQALLERLDNLIHR